MTQRIPVWTVDFQEFDADFNLIKEGYLSKHTTPKGAYEEAIKLNQASTNRIHTVNPRQINKERYPYM